MLARIRQRLRWLFGDLARWRDRLRVCWAAGVERRRKRRSDKAKAEARRAAQGTWR